MKSNQQGRSRNFPYGGYDPFFTPSAKIFAQTPTPMTGRPPFSPGYPQPQMPAPFTQNFHHPNMPAPYPGQQMPYPFMQQPGMQPFGQKSPFSPFSPFGQNSQGQGNGFSWGTALNGANQFMGIMQQLGSVLSIFK